MLDKTEAPTIPDGYGISVAYACLLDVVHSISIYMERSEKPNENGEVKTKDSSSCDKNSISDAERSLKVQLVVSSWCGLLAALIPLVELRYDA